MFFFDLYLLFNPFASSAAYKRRAQYTPVWVRAPPISGGHATTSGSSPHISGIKMMHIQLQSAVDNLFLFFFFFFFFFFVAKYRHNVVRHQSRPVDNPMRLTERHFPSFYKPRNKNLKRRCVVCSRNDKRSDSRYECNECDVGLCIDPCFKIYHTQLYY